MRNEAVIAQLTRGSIAKILLTLTIPMAISLGFGVLFGTLITLILAKLRLPGPARANRQGVKSIIFYDTHALFRNLR